MSFNYHLKFTCGALLKNMMSLRVRLFVINANVPIDCNRHTRVRNAQMLASGSECQLEMRSLGRQPVISEVQFSESARDASYYLSTGRFLRIARITTAFGRKIVDILPTLTFLFHMDFFHSNKHTIKKNFEFNKQIQYISQFFTEWCNKWCVRIYHLYRNQLIKYEYELILASKRKKMFTVEFDWRIY